MQAAFFRAAPSLLGQHILNLYMDLVNNAVNINSSAIWAQMSLDEVSEKLHQMLLTNERYVGTVSDVILSEKANANEKNYTLEKDSLSVSISRVEFQQNSETIAQFKYDDTFIWTDDIGTLNRSEGEDLKVYALRYKSWSHMIREILIKQSELTTNSSVLDEVDIENHSRHTRSVEPSTGEMTQNKSFIGEGGVVSLSTKQNGVKRSVPVTYWIRFDEETFLNLTDSSDKSNSQVCLSCEYLEAETISWKSKGCHVVSADKQGVTCKCNHTTNFAAFMMPAETMFDMTEQESLIFDTISIIGSALSVVGLLASLTIFYLVRHLVRNERFKAHTNLSLALLGVHILFLMGDIFLKNNTVCVISTVLTHYFLLASFMWMLVEGIFLYLYVVQVFMRSKIASYNWMYAVGWLIPVLIVAIAAGYGIPHDLYVMEIAEKRSEVEITPQCPEGTMPFPPRNEGKVTIRDSGEQKYERCWLSTSNWMIWSFLIPAILVLVFNSIIMCKTLHICVTSLKTSSKIRSRNKMYNNGSKSSPPRSSSSSRYASGQASSIEEQQHFGTYDRLHGQAGNGKTTPTRVPIVVSTSPCLLQVTTEEEECKQGINDIKEDDSVSSTESLAVAFKTESLHPHSNDNKEVSAPRFQTVSGDSTRLYNSRTSVMYRNSVSCSPKVKVRSPSFNNKNAPLESTDKYHFFQDAKTAVKGALVLLPILGVPWVCGFLAHFSQVFTMLFIILNSTQGIAIFIVYCLFNGEVRRAIHRRLEKRNMKYAVDNGRRRTSSTSTVARSFLRFGRRRSTVTTTA
uniref:uncharacterized protein LOC120342711 n=1 Tax=Styela clava TaxID=7725 RepID=UPI0019398E27|nr:uncharacterized protein LOC120342711 [Styela clava]